MSTIESTFLPLQFFQKQDPEKGNIEQTKLYTRCFYVPFYNKKMCV